MSDLNLENIVGFKAVDKNGNERQVTVDEMTELVSARIVSAASEISTFAAAAAAGTDEFEDQLPQSDTFSWLRTLDGSKNPTLTSSSAAAKVLGELIGVANAEKNGLMSVDQYNHIFPLLGIWTTNVENQVVKITFSGKWSALIGVMKNANLNGGLVYIMGSAYNTSIGTLHSIATARLGSIGFYSKTDNANEIIIINLGEWAEISAIIFTGEIEKMEVIEGDNISLSDYTKMDY